MAEQIETEDREMGTSQPLSQLCFPFRYSFVIV
jgi:hypothetical protein